LITYTSCPVCASADFLPAVKATDFTVSRKEFEIVQCNRCSLRFTQGIPAANEIGAYYQSDDYVSHTNTQKGLVNQLYHKIRKHTLRQKLRLVQQCTGLKKGRLLDIGAGTGTFIQTMNNAGWRTEGLEPDAAARERALKLYQAGLKPAEKLFEEEAESFDAITLWHVLEHVHELHRYIAQLHFLLKPGGKIIIAVPNYTSYDAWVYQGYWAAYDVPRHLYHFSPQSMKVLMEKHELAVEALRPMWFDSFYISLLSGQYKTGKTQLLKAGTTGLLSNLKALINRHQCSSITYIIGKK
jgi:2-polyprenyl-3-methyl-5-hydroxy-6-metoxy-1,4-benzoquinol methylase